MHTAAVRRIVPPPMKSSRSSFLLGALCVLGVAPGCELEEDVVEVPVADPLVFRDEVYPILLGDCGFTGCHGNPDRFFAVFGTARARLDPATYWSRFHNHDERVDVDSLRLSVDTWDHVCRRFLT